MNKDKFEMILDNDEEIKWCKGVDSKAYLRKSLYKTFLLGLFPPFAILMLGIPYTLVLLILSLLNIIPMPIGIIHFIFSIIAIAAYTKYLEKEANNTYFCITDKRIIKRSGAFNNKFIHYSLKNVGTIEVVGELFDTKEPTPSANLMIKVKNFHQTSDGEGAQSTLLITSLSDAYEAYKVLSELTEGNNEVIRVKNEK